MSLGVCDRRKDVIGMLVNVYTGVFSHTRLNIFIYQRVKFF